MKKEYDALVFIGRFSPLHLGHIEVIKQALNQADKVIVLIGSAFHARDARNPWTFEERKQMIVQAFSSEFMYPADSKFNNLIVKPLPDYPYDDNKWKASVRSVVSTSLSWSDFPPKIGLIGHNKDHTSYYLRMFPDWGSVEVDNYLGLNATDIRKDFFFNYDNFDSSPLHTSTYNLLKEQMKNGTLNSIIKEIRLVEAYKKQFIKPDKNEIINFLISKGYSSVNSEILDIVSSFSDQYCTPYPPTFATVDAVVVQSGHVLLVKRKAEPGIGLWALPGGFLNPNETLLNGAIRELKEETKIKVPERLLKKMGENAPHKTFDDPHRSTRGRTLTTAFFFDLGDDNKLPKVVGSDDAEKAVWVPFDKVNRQEMFEDHFAICDYFLNIG